MKTRNGFVSNSSSSSFILGLGKISNFEIFRKWLDSYKRSYDLGDIRVFGTWLWATDHWFCGFVLMCKR